MQKNVLGTVEPGIAGRHRWSAVYNVYIHIYIYIYIYIYTFARRMLLPYDCWRERWQSRTCQSVGTCLGDGHLSKEYWCARRLHQPGQTSPDAYLGWHWHWRHLRIEGSNVSCGIQLAPKPVENHGFRSLRLQNPRNMNDSDPYDDGIICSCAIRIAALCSQ